MRSLPSLSLVIVAVALAPALARAQDPPPPPGDTTAQDGLIGPSLLPPNRRDQALMLRRMGLHGGPSEVEYLTGWLLTRPELRDEARMALERIPGDAATEALQGALATVRDDSLVGIVDSLGVRGAMNTDGGLGTLAPDDEALAHALFTAMGRSSQAGIGWELMKAEFQFPRKYADTFCHAILDCAWNSEKAGDAAAAAKLYQPMMKELRPPSVRIAAFLGYARTAPVSKANVEFGKALAGKDPVMWEAALRYLPVAEQRAGLVIVARKLMKRLPADFQLRLLGQLTADESLDAEALGELVEGVDDPEVKRAALLTLLDRLPLENLALGARAASPDDLEPDHGGSEAPAAIDGDPGTYWDEVDDQEVYRLLIGLPEPRKVSAISILGHSHESYAPRDFTVKVDGRPVASVAGARYEANRLWVPFEATEGQRVELDITGYYGRSPAIRELGIWDLGTLGAKVREAFPIAAPPEGGSVDKRSRGDDQVRALIPDEERARIRAAVPAHARVEPKEPRRLLVFSKCWGYVHSAIPYGKVAIHELAAKTGAFEVVISDDPALFEEDSLETFDAIVLNNSNNEVFLPENPDELSEAERKAAYERDARLKQSLLDFVAGGKGLAVLHAGVATFREWPEFGELMGARFENHPWGAGSTVALKVDDPGHPVAAAFTGIERPTISDEIYQLAAPYSREDARVLLSVDLERTEITPQQESLFRREDRDFPISYVRGYGQGRVFYCALGHQHELFWNETVLQHYLDGIQLALGDLEGNTTPSSVVDSIRPYYLDWAKTREPALLCDDVTVWKLNLEDPAEKAYFHPLALTDGTPLTWLSPPDHVWHRSLWFSWKFINGVNYWEEVEGRGFTELREFGRDQSAVDFSAQYAMTLEYHPPFEEPVMREERHVRVSPPDERRGYQITWRTTFTALDQDVVLDRTPPADEPDGQSWGGYAGMSVRIAKETRDWRILDSEGREGLACHRQPARWIRADFARTDTGREAGIAILDHPGNQRHPTPSFVIQNPEIPFIYYSPAILFDGPLTLKAGESLSLAYRIVVHPGRQTNEWIDEEWKRFAETPLLYAGA